ncbi:MAG: MBL fold metallo-hydrolase [Chloroflexi bacterium]|nr:MBL fold metallo-hydrolase [Chloroflexota bacterium]
MRRERVADDIYIFTSELYAQVTAGLVVTPQGAVLIDTMVFPEEARMINRFVQERLNTTVRFIINTHYHADHTYGNCFFDNAIIVGHEICYRLLNEIGRASLAEAKQSSSVFEEVEIRLPNIVFNTGSLELRLAGKTLELEHLPGHSPDSITVYVREDRVLFAGDLLMPIPFFVDGSFEDFRQSLMRIKGRGYENVIQGHGDVILRGEIEDKIDEDLSYLSQIESYASRALSERKPYDFLETIDVEKVGKSRILLNGGVEGLHQQNLRNLYDYLASAEK